MSFYLGLNLGFAVNRYIEPEQWVPLVRRQLDVRCVQLTADMFMPYMMDDLALTRARRTRAVADAHGLKIVATFTGAFTRLNHFGHPDPQVRAYWLKWFERFAEVSVILGAESMGSHFGIQTVEQCADAVKREQALQVNVDCWRRLAETCQGIGLTELTWEPMSVAREYGHTIAEAARIQQLVSDFALPMRMCLDVDHGDVASTDPRDTDPYAWLAAFAPVASIIHLKQSYADKGGHWPFTDEHNQRGRIDPGRVIERLQAGGRDAAYLMLELSFRERTPVEQRLESDLAASVDYWRSVCDG